MHDKTSNTLYLNIPKTKIKNHPISLCFWLPIEYVYAWEVETMQWRPLETYGCPQPPMDGETLLTIGFIIQ